MLDERTHDGSTTIVSTEEAWRIVLSGRRRPSPPRSNCHPEILEAMHLLATAHSKPQPNRRRRRLPRDANGRCTLPLPELSEIESHYQEDRRWAAHVAYTVLIYLCASEPRLTKIGSMSPAELGGNYEVPPHVTRRVLLWIHRTITPRMRGGGGRRNIHSIIAALLDPRKIPEEVKRMPIPANTNHIVCPEESFVFDSTGGDRLLSRLLACKPDEPMSRDRRNAEKKLQATMLGRYTDMDGSISLPTRVPFCERIVPSTLELLQSIAVGGEDLFSYPSANSSSPYKEVRHESPSIATRDRPAHGRRNHE